MRISETFCYFWPAATPNAPARTVGGKQVRLTIDLPQQLHARFKMVCAINQTRMIEEFTRFLDDWTQKHNYVVRV